MLMVFLEVASILLIPPGSSKTLETAATQKSLESKETWLEDEIYYYDYLADSPVGQTDPEPRERCPPVPDTFKKRRACRRKKCTSDGDCKKKRPKCCFNGCVHTCMREIRSPALLDWRQQPRRKVDSASYWLIRDGEELEEVESCSTSATLPDEDPLLCPQGYICHIVDPGKPKNGIPNRGHCVKETDDDDIQVHTAGQEKLNPEYVDPTSCYDKKVIMLNGASKTHGDKWCVCNSGTLTCQEKPEK